MVLGADNLAVGPGFLGWDLHQSGLFYRLHVNPSWGKKLGKQFRDFFIFNGTVLFCFFHLVIRCPVLNWRPLMLGSAWFATTFVWVSK